MDQKAKILVTEDGSFDLTTCRWDDHRFSDLLLKENRIDADKAIELSKFLRDEITKMDIHTITMPIVENIVSAELKKYGLTKSAPIRLDKSIFVPNGLVLSANAKTVLERRYLKKDIKCRLK